MSGGGFTTPAAGGPALSGTVVTETAYGQASAAGVAATASRGDHTHGTPTRVFTTQSVVTGSRSFGTVFQNTSGFPMLVAVTATGTLAWQINALTDAANPPVTAVSRSDGPNTNVLNVTFLVLPGNFYQVTFAGGVSTLVIWTEWT
jgi:hypothetical protein